MAFTLGSLFEASILQLQEWNIPIDALQCLTCQSLEALSGLQVVDGLIWVYGSCEPGAEAEAATKSIENSRVPKRDESITIPWFMRDLPYGIETLLENVRTLPSKA